LPEVIHITAFDARSPGAVDSVLPLLIREMKEAKPGTASIAERLAEVLLVQVLRLLFTEARRPEGFLAGLADPQLSTALRQIHGAADRKLSLDSLATSAGMSRSAFALRFKKRLGLSPIEYLAKWRMYRASELLQGEGLSLGQVASRVGYESEIAFSRAFKREFAVSPGAYRRLRSHRRAE
jgi:transcriptional regulator GlxA family with amidase domain